MSVLDLCLEAASDTPFIVVSGKKGEEYAVEAMRAGAQDYVTKQKLVRLAPAVSRELEQVAQQREEAARQRALEAELSRAKRLEATGKLAGGLAHNLNNALATILGNLDLAMRSNDVRESQTFTRRAQNAIARATLVVRQLSNLSAEPTILPSEFDLNVLVGEVLTMLEPVLPDSVSIYRTFDCSNGTVTTDPFAIEQILINLILNARDAISGEGIIECRTVLTTDGCKLVVTDSGEGMSDELQAHVFEPFFTTKTELGTGMGLASVDQLVTALKGRIELVSSEGSGSQFTISLPNLASVFRDSSNLSGRILIVHSDERIRFRIHSVLKRNGLVCESAPNVSGVEIQEGFDLAMIEETSQSVAFESPQVKRIVRLTTEPADVSEDGSVVLLDETTSEVDLINMMNRFLD